MDGAVAGAVSHLRNAPGGQVARFGRTNENVTEVPTSRPDDAARLRSSNIRTALILLSIAVVFFGGIILSQSIGGLSEGMTMLGIGVLLFLAVAIGRNLRSKR